MRATLNLGHVLLAGLAIVTRLADAAGLSMFPEGSLSSAGLPSVCEATLYQSINCADETAGLAVDGYLDSDDPAITKLVCRPTCGGAIGHMRTKVASACGTEEMVPGMSFVHMVDKLWSSWNQTCFTDPKTGKLCHDVIAAFPEVDDVSKLSKSDLCSYCNVEQYKIMQADAYTGAYDEYAQSNYQYVAKTCDLKVDNFNATDSAFNVTNPDASSDICVSGKIYDAKAGDSCDSIALSQGVSAATMYYINSNIFDCTKIAAGTNLCLPLTCTNIYQVQKGDTCLDIALNNGIMSDQLLSYNSQLNWNCTNLHDADPYWGSTLCVSTPGGLYAGQPLNNNTANVEPQRVDPPSGTTVANGTTLECSHWFTYDGDLSCTQICLANDVAINLFTEINPSLNKTTCDQDLIVGNAYCVEPVTGWDLPALTEAATSRATGTESPTGTKATAVTASTTPTSTSEKVPSPTQPGIVDNCNKWHYVDNGDGCYSIAEKSHISLADFYKWNSKVGNDCSGLWLHYYVCVGVAS
ncbi:uncharacterized protein FSUBG_7489 [Fusarium subglutinans]|uniref:LysM domain-containing protein n=1 Tax=Gibberella subglutinans TaxID=42677 RepID=A0A8H5PUG4_GIBSU|nr:uncharacterized protein FSUBG_7489 [Fusarium subglutinans]KAF5602849.1 hypothetical protein FSUBG_7489 [Fusarium subglutinans]